MFENRGQCISENKLIEGMKRQILLMGGDVLMGGSGLRRVWLIDRREMGTYRREWPVFYLCIELKVNWISVNLELIRCIMVNLKLIRMLY